MQNQSLDQILATHGTMRGGLVPVKAGKPWFMPTLRAYGGLTFRESPPIRDVLGRLGPLEVRLAVKAKEVRSAQKLRYRVFFKEGTAIADARAMFAQRDFDTFDSFCDHMLVVDHELKSKKLKPKVVGTYRLLRQDVAEQNGGFYSDAEFDVSSLIARHPDSRFLELGRSCVLPPYRNKRTVELLWHGIWTYVKHHRLDVMIGCASLEGTNPDAMRLPLSFLHHYARAPDEWRASALPERHVDMNRMAKDEIDPKAALHALPPLIKGYLRLGAYIGDGAVIDHQFGTTDVLIILPVSSISARYIGHFGADASRHSA